MKSIFMNMLIATSLIAFMVVSVSPAMGKDKSGDRSYYLTPTHYLGDEVLNACADGFHFASIWEIRDTSNFTYNTNLGFTTVESGFGPPVQVAGWLRNGLNDGRTCENWTVHEGFIGPVGEVAPWEIFEVPPDQGGDGWNLFYLYCGDALPVWCVSDSGKAK